MNYCIVLENMSWANWFQVMRTYFVVPIQRILCHFETDSLQISDELIDELSEIHVTQDLEPILKKEMDVHQLMMAKYKQLDDDDKEIVTSKLKHFLAQWTTIISFQNKLGPHRIKGGMYVIKYIQSLLFYGPLETLLNQNVQQDQLLGNFQGFMILFLSETFTKYNKEKLSYNEKEIKNMIEVKNELERVHVIKGFDKLGDDEKQIELMNKRLGLGQWAVGGTKLIYAYDKDYYDLEREKRLQAGIIGFQGSGDGTMPVPAGSAHDALGFPQHREESGYDHGYDDGER
jgi:hypothetical protein